MTRKKGKPRQRTANAIQQMKLFIHGLDTLYYVASIKYPLLDLHPDIMRTVTKEVEQGLSRAQLYGQLQKPLCFEDMKIIRDSILEDMTIYLQREIHQALPLSRIKSLQDDAKRIHGLFVEERERSAAIASTHNCQCKFQEEKPRTNPEVITQPQPQHITVANKDDGINVDQISSQQGPSAENSSNDVMLLKDWIAKIGTTSDGVSPKEPEVELSAACNIRPIAKSNKRTAVDDERVLGSSDGEVGLERPSLLCHGAIIIQVKCQEKFEVIQRSPVQPLLNTLRKLFETSSQTKRQGLNYTPLFTHASTQKRRKLRLELTTKSQTDLKLLEQHPEWADRLCLPFPRPKVYIVQALQSPDTAWQQLLQLTKQEMTESLLCSNGWLEDVLDISWVPKFEAGVLHGTCFRITLSTRGSANLVLKNGVNWKGEHLSCTILDGPTFDSGSHIPDHSYCKYFVTQSPDGLVCHNCSGQHRANSKDCPIFRKFAEEGRFPSSARLSRAMENLQNPARSEDNNDQSKSEEKVDFTFSVDGLDSPNQSVNFFGRPLPIRLRS